MKEKFRKTAAALRIIIPKKDRERWNHIIQKQLLSREEWTNARTICLYMSLPEEVSTHVLFVTALSQKKVVVLPRVERSGLQLHIVTSVRDLVRGAHGVLEPKKSCKRLAPKSVDLFIIPGVAFDKQGYRLGWGKGYYDRLLKGLTAFKIGLSFDIQVVAEAPHTSYDVPMTSVISERNVYGE